MGCQESMNIPTTIIIGFQQRKTQDLPNLKNETFCRLPLTSCQCIIGTDNFAYSGLLLNYDDDYIHGFGQIKEAFRALAKDDLLQPYISDHDCTSSHVRADDAGYNLYVFDIQFQQSFTASLPIKVEFKFDGVVCNDINAYGLVLTKKLVSSSSDGQRNFDLI